MSVKTEIFKKKFDRQPKEIPDTPRINDYEASDSADMNSLTDQRSL